MRRRAALCRRGLAALTAAEAQRAEKIKTRPKSVRSDRRAVGMKPSEVREGERTRRRALPTVPLYTCPHVTCVHAWLDAKETTLHSC